MRESEEGRLINAFLEFCRTMKIISRSMEEATKALQSIVEYQKQEPEDLQIILKSSFDQTAVGNCSGLATDHVVCSICKNVVQPGYCICEDCIPSKPSNFVVPSGYAITLGLLRKDITSVITDLLKYTREVNQGYTYNNLDLEAVIKRALNLLEVLNDV